MSIPPQNSAAEKTTPEDLWPEALASVTACRYQFGAGRALAFGILTRKHFLISYNYEVAGEMHTGELLSATAMPQGHLFPIRYNPEQPHTNQHSGALPSLRNPVIAVGIAGSLILSLLWFLILRGCH